MKKIVFLLLIFLAACAAEEIVPPTESTPTEETIPAEITPEETPVEETKEPEELEVIEEIEEEPTADDKEFFALPDKTISRVSCDGEALTFTITNTVDKIMSLRTLSFPPPKEKQMLTITINSYNAWNPGDYFTQSSLRDCVDDELAPGESIECTVAPIPLVKENEFSRNTILAQSTRVFEKVNFEC